MTQEEFKEIESQLKDGFIDVPEFIRRVPDEYFPNKWELMAIIKEKNNGNNNSDL